jgi:hypothetical protein
MTCIRLKPQGRRFDPVPAHHFPWPASGPDSGSRQEEQGMPVSHGALLTPAEHEAAQLLVTLALRLDGGQLVSADQLLARLCGIPTNDVAMASIVLLRQVAHSVAPALQRPPVEILDHLRTWLAGRAGGSG